MIRQGVYRIASVLFAFATPMEAAERPAGSPTLRQPRDVAMSVDTATLDRQYRALSAMPSVKVAYSALGPVRSIEGDTGIVLSSRARALKAGESGAEILGMFKDTLLATGDESLTVAISMASGDRFRVIRFEQSIDGIPVRGGGVSLQFEEATGIVRTLGASFLPDRGLPRNPKLTAAQASSIAVEVLETQGLAKPQTVSVSGTPSLSYYGAVFGSTRVHLVWKVLAVYEPLRGRERTDGIFWIDAIDGEYLGSQPYSMSSLARTVYTANNAAPIPDTFPSGLVTMFEMAPTLNSINRVSKLPASATCV